MEIVVNDEDNQNNNLGLIASSNEEIFELVSNDERNKLLYEWSGVLSESRVDKAIVEIFEEQAHLNSEKIAVVHKGKEYTYQELNKKVNQFANYIQSINDYEGKYIAVCKEKDLEYIIIILAILKVGAVYIPVDSNYPISRVNFILKDSHAELLISSKFFYSQLITLYSTKINWIDFDKNKINKQSNYYYKKISPEAKAYLIYTSGTTGQ